MRTLFWQMMVSLDGYMEGPNRELDWHVIDDDFNRYGAEMLGSIDAMVLGRVTYELFAGYWPSATEPEARTLNELPKVVFSRTLDRVHWNNSRLAKGSVAEELGRLKRQPGKDIAIFGSAELASTCMRLGLIDEYRVLVAPVVLGRGAPMFKHVEGRVALKLLRTRTFGSGVVVLSYGPA